MDQTTYADQVAAEVAARLNWPLDEAHNVTGDTADYEAEGLTVAEAADATIEAISAST